MPYILLYLFLAALCLLSIRFCPTGADIKKTMNRLHELRFIFAVLIIFSHCTNPFSPMPHILLPLSKISTLGVGYFFISSGFGLACSVASKPNYLRNFWKKIVNLLWITLFSSVVSTLIRNTMLGEHQIFQLVNWYMPTLIALYLVFYISYRIFPKNKFRRVAFLSGVIFIITALLCAFDAVTGLNHRVYYISELAFPFGVFIYEYADILASFLKKKYALPLIVAAELIFSFFGLTVPEKSLPDLIFHNLMIFPFGLLLIWLLDKFKVGNRIISAMNPYAPFLYLFQFVVLDVMKNYYITNARPLGIFYFWGVLFFTCILAIALQHLYNFIGAEVHKHFCPNRSTL